MWVLLGIAVIVAGFVLRFNPLLVILVSALVTGIAAGLDPVAIIAAFGRAFNEARYVSVVWLVLPVVGMLEAFGLQERARALIERMRGATVGRLLTGYMLLRQATAAVGLISIAGHAQTVRPLVAPMAEAAGDRQAEVLGEDEREEVKAWSAATDNVGVFFGEDIFLAIGSILLIKGLLEQYGYDIEPLHLSVWAIPTAIAAALIHGFRLWRLDRRLNRLGLAEDGA
ncbi:hypothetical protein B2G71_15240 [Novosphingobium sp. PC22D]|uniref:DUF969 domain-containing protein n=1 Tax=Novosphingobium sp. PC22D TaxID=1962403 RepID=UPI000BF05512|nr:DUF969 domain-containing protein [Novosphingobium sp. PC22D]PEQ11798.1 hypothetical protein B2G71_15240 [Novosphingobium sp. PC22D]